MPDFTLPGAWHGCLIAFLDDIESRSGSVRSRGAYADLLRLFFTAPDKSPEQYTRADVRAYAASGSHNRYHPGVPVSISTRNARVSALTSFYRFASAYEVDGQPLFTGISPTAGTRYLKPPLKYRAMSADELTRLFAVIPDTLAGCRDRAFYLTLFWTVRRKSEILRLKWGDIEATTFPDGRKGFLYRYQGKGASRETRTAELPGPAYTAILAYLTRVKRYPGIQPGESVFCAVYPGRGQKDRRRRPLASATVNAAFKGYIRAAGLEDARHLSIHSLRHTAVRCRYESGEDVVSLKTLLNHSSLQTTDIYLRGLVGVADSGALLIEEKFAHLSGAR